MYTKRKSNLRRKLLWRISRTDAKGVMGSRYCMMIIPHFRLNRAQRLLRQSRLGKNLREDNSVVSGISVPVKVD